MNIVSIQFNEHEAIYLQLSQHIQREIARVKPAIGEKLPPIRTLAKVLGINNGTVVRAYKDLELKGFVHAKRGSGYEIIRYTDAIESVQLAVMNPDVCENQKARKINFASATPNPSMFPIETFKACFNHVLDRDQGYAFEYQEGSGYAPLRKSLCTYLKKEKDVQISHEQVLIVSGAQQGLDIVSKAYIQAGDKVLTESPTYTGAVCVFESRGAKVLGVRMDADGVNLQDLEHMIAKHRPKLFYMMSHYQNPTTVCYSKYKVKKILALAEKYDFLIVEDDSLSELSYVNCEKNEVSAQLYGHLRVITIKSFSKLLMPGLRIGFLIVPTSELLSILQAKYVSDISSSGFIQRTVDIYFRSGRWTTHLESMKACYKENYKVMKEELTTLKEKGVTFVDPKGGVFFWVHFPKNISAYELQRRCLAKDVQFVSGHFFSVQVEGEKYEPNAIRMSFAAVQTAEIFAGFQVIRACIEEMLEEKKRESYGLPWV